MRRAALRELHQEDVRTTLLQKQQAAAVHFGQEAKKKVKSLRHMRELPSAPYSDLCARICPSVGMRARRRLPLGRRGRGGVAAGKKGSGTPAGHEEGAMGGHMQPRPSLPVAEKEPWGVARGLGHRCQGMRVGAGEGKQGHRGAAMTCMRPQRRRLHAMCETGRREADMHVRFCVRW